MQQAHDAKVQHRRQQVGAAALDQQPPLQAAAVPDSQSSTLHIAHAAVSQPSQPNAAVNAPQTAATAALTNKNTLLF